LFGKTVEGKTTGGILEAVLGVASTAMGMQMQQQAMEMQSQMMEEEQPPAPPPPQNGGGPPPGDWDPGYGGWPPGGVPGDYTGGDPGRAIGGPLQIINDAIEAIKRPFIGKPMLVAVVVVGLGGGVAYYLYRRRR